MGTDIPLDNVGLPCVICWGRDKPFGERPTPKRILLTAAGIIKGPLWEPGFGEPFSGSIVLHQRSTTHCEWYGEESGFGGSIGFQATRTGVIILSDIGFEHFFWSGSPVCATSVGSMNLMYFVGGTVTLTIPRVII